MTIVAATRAALTTAWLPQTATLFTRAGQVHSQLAFLQTVTIKHTDRLLHIIL
jgi:hypothetical protein